MNLYCVLVIGVLTILVKSSCSIDPNGFYCDPELCKIWNGTDYNYVDHIACKNNGSLSKDCLDGATMVNMNERRINLLLNLHNTARNKIALGKIKGYASAENMPLLKWDKELEYTASLNVKTCKFAHDHCRNTYRFPYSGQNIAISAQNPPFHSNSKRIKIAVSHWFREYVDANQTYIDSFHVHPKGKQIGHFAMMVADRAKHVGCSAIRYWYGNKGLAFLMTCNYDFTPIFTQPIFKTGKPASRCSKVHEKYHGLCDWDEDYDESEESNEIYGNEIDDVLKILTKITLIFTLFSVGILITFKSIAFEAIKQ